MGQSAHKRYDVSTREDETFERKFVEAWDTRPLFANLAENFSLPPLDPQQVAEIDRIKAVILGHAANVWPDGRAELELIGSTRLGTGIVKRGGERSDRDYSLTLCGGTSDREWELFSQRLSADDRLYNVRLGSKSIAFVDTLLNIPWDLVPTEGAFTYNMVPYPTLAGTNDRRQQLLQREDFYEQYPGARNATKVLKRLFFHLKGHVIEGIVYYEGRQMIAAAPEDAQGLRIFKKVFNCFVLYPGGDDEGALRALRNDSGQQGQQERQELDRDLLRASDVARRLNDIIFDVPDRCDFPFWIKKVLFCIVGFVIGIVVSLVFYILFEKLFQQFDFSHHECSDSSCLCNDCEHSVWKEWKHNGGQSPQCMVLSMVVDRCLIRSFTRHLRCVVFAVLFAVATLLWRRGPAKSQKWLLRTIAFAVLFCLLSALTDLSETPLVRLSCLCLGIADTCRLSTVGWITFLHSRAVTTSWEVLCRCAMDVCLLTAFALQVATVFSYSYGQDAFFLQHHLYNLCCLVLETLVAAWAYCICVGDHARQHSRQIVVVQCLWCWVVGWHLYYGFYQKGSFSQFRFGANLGKTFLLVLRYCSSLHFVSQTIEQKDNVGWRLVAIRAHAE
eukprot:TRINITY_DN37713_c0_g1_i2.p1 TRINITY_DN37713_c0_g1~~TRINITY_DN37713_c0_g1_i2.p1  ORF type:complete len:634 (-),score=54.29 TRINITY_DN37713_c0_g1_i2:530-2374(-)